MNLASLIPILEEAPEFQALIKRMRAGEPSAESLQTVDAARPFVLAAMHSVLSSPMLIVTARPDRAKQMIAELGAWSGAPDRIRYFAEPEPLIYERLPWSPETVAFRLGALASLLGAGGTPPIVVSTVRALLPYTAPEAEFRAASIVLKQGQAIAPGDLVTRWAELGYENQAVVESPGWFSRRGGILDLWPPAQEAPVRIEFVGDTIESLRRFDPATQRSKQVVESLVITAASEALLAHTAEVANRVRRWDLHNTHPVAATTFRQDLEALEEKRRFRGIEFYLPYFYIQPSSLLDYLGPRGLIVIDDWQELEAAARQFEGQADQVREDLLSRGEIPPGLSRPHFTWEELRAGFLAHHRLLFDYQSPREMPSLPFDPGQRFGGQLSQVVDEVKKGQAAHDRLVVVTRQSERLAELLREREIFVKPKGDLAEPPGPGHIELIQGALNEGWKLTLNGPEGGVSPSSQLVLLTDAEIFGWARPRQRRLTALAARPQSPEAFFADLAVGDYVVHIDHGIGVFRGLQKMDLGGPEREYLLIEYAHGDRLYVPVHQIDRLSRYVAPGGNAPTLQRLGTVEWGQIKERTRQAVAEIARELLELYAAREVVNGHAYASDSIWQHEFEAGFPYAETEDQIQAIEQVKEDMQKPKPMDRLIVGDVGYGKTEVALRAAFKAVEGHKQVAVLVPTTVLAQQHFNTFRERLSPFPINVEMLSRFRSEKEQAQIISKLASGGVDIVIGTHRLLSRDVKFRDLGLLIIDEEQRFGVAHKERMKQLRQEVDVLTLTATPIPRTLYLSLSGARDMSTIETPPEQRQPIRTYLTAYDERLVRDAILRELDRGGQVYYVHNRVRGIGIIAQQLQKLVPEARIALGHGQMPEEELEMVMADFAAGKYDLLVCTTIIESGIDIPNANTILINNADKFGLAQLYQLRGRVGRSTVRAYAYFLFDKRQELSEEAHARLRTIAESAELGAGFQIAMRDLEIRGAGEVLGARQSGHIAAVGFDLYCRLLARAVEEFKSRVGRPEPAAEERETAQGNWLASPNLELPLEAQIPEHYVPDAGLRLRLYRRMADIATNAQLVEITREFEDRFGPPPEEMKNLLYLLQLKLAAQSAGVAAIAMEEDRVLVRFAKPDEQRAASLSRHFGDRVRISLDRAWMPGPGHDRHWREHLSGFVQAARRPRASVPDLAAVG